MGRKGENSESELDFSPRFRDQCHEGLAITPTESFWVGRSLNGMRLLNCPWQRLMLWPKWGNSRNKFLLCRAWVCSDVRENYLSQPESSAWSAFVALGWRDVQQVTGEADECQVISFSVFHRALEFPLLHRQPVKLKERRRYMVKAQWISNKTRCSVWNTL